MSGTLKSEPSNKTVVIGAGNEFRGDDGAGQLAATRLRERLSGTVRVLSLPGQATELMAAWEGCDRAFIIDAVCSGAKAGTVHRLDAAQRPLPRELFRFSTHGFGVMEAIELCRALGSLPSNVTIYGIEGANFAAGTEVTPPVAEAIDVVVDRVVQDVERQC
jgi:hydrogenase maturation protease